MVCEEDEMYPEEFYRGISDGNSITDEGYVTAAAFDFQKSKNREDHFYELSINWNDDEGALINLKSRHKKGTTDRQFKAGYCVVNSKQVAQFLSRPIKENKLMFERKPEEATEDNDFQENKYHGNLLMQEGIDNRIKKNIQHVLATAAEAHKWDDDVDEKHFNVF